MSKYKSFAITAKSIWPPRFLSASVMSLCSSCTVNDEGEFELTYVFWIILGSVIFGFIISSVNTYAKAKKRGISYGEMLKEEVKENEKREKIIGIDVEYLGGYPQWSTPCKVNFSIKNSDIVLKKGYDSVVIKRDMIVAISNEKSSHRSVGKTAAGAILGGVLTGGIGIIVGGALGARRKNTSEVYITYLYKGVELTLNLKPGKNIDKVYAWINSVFA